MRNVVVTTFEGEEEGLGFAEEEGMGFAEEEEGPGAVGGGGAGAVGGAGVVEETRVDLRVAGGP